MSDKGNQRACPRCVGLPDYGIDYSKFPDDGHCKHCGSLDADTFMARLEAGTIRLDPTDKNYKVYVHNDGGEKFKFSYRIDSVEKRAKAAAKFLENVRPEYRESVMAAQVKAGELSLDDAADIRAYAAGEPLDPMKNWKWTTEERNETKFYFQHLGESQMKRFVELLNEKKVKLNEPGYFYRKPFFVV